MSVTNLGTQTINWKYKTSLKGSNLSKMFNGCINPGIYLNNGAYISAGTGLVTSFANNQITINAFTAVFRASSTQTVHISTAAPIMLSTDGGLGYITEAAPYITMSYTWADQIINYIDFAFKAQMDVTAYDIVIGKAQFSAGSVISIDYSVATHPPVYNPTTNNYLYKGNEISTKNTITGYNSSTTFGIFATNTDIYYSGTANRTADITAGASITGTELCMINTSPTYTVVITYETGKTITLSYNNYVRFKWNGTVWKVLSSTQNNVTSVLLTSTDVTLYNAQFISNTIILSGTLTGNRNLILPDDTRTYKIINNCTSGSNYYVYVKTASGNGVYMSTGDIYNVYCNGASILPLSLEFTSREITFNNITWSMGSNVSLVPLASPISDPLSEIGSSIFTAKNAGMYQIRGYAIPTAALTQIILSVYKNGVNVVNGSRDSVNTATSEIRSSLSTIISLSAGDNLSLYVTTAVADSAMKCSQISILQIK